MDDVRWETDLSQTGSHRLSHAVTCSVTALTRWTIQHLLSSSSKQSVAACQMERVGWHMTADLEDNQQRKVHVMEWTDDHFDESHCFSKWCRTHPLPFQFFSHAALHVSNGPCQVQHKFGKGRRKCDVLHQSAELSWDQKFCWKWQRAMRLPFRIAQLCVTWKCQSHAIWMEMEIPDKRTKGRELR